MDVEQIFSKIPLFGREAFLVDMEKAQRGDVEAMVNVGMAYWRGDGVGDNLIEAKHWLSRAAELGDPKARGLLDILLSNPEAGMSQQYKSCFGCIAGLPFIASFICFLILGMSKDVSKESLISCLIILILSDIILFVTAIFSKGMGITKWIKLYWMGGLICIALTIYIFLVLFTS